MALQVPSGIRQLPIVGPWASRIGRVINIWGMPCNPDAEVWVYAAWRTIPMMLLALVKPSPIEYLNSRFGNPHRRKRPRMSMKGATSVEGRGVPIPGEYSWVKFSIGVGLRFFQYVQFIDITTRGAVQWSSMVYSWSGCPTPGGGGGNQTLLVPTVVSGALSNTALTLGTNVTYEQLCIGGAFTWACQANKEWSASYSVSWEQIEGFPPPNPEFILCDGAGNPVGGSDFGPKKDGLGNTNQGFFRRDNLIGSPKTFSIFYKADFSFLVTAATFNVSATNTSDFMKPDP